MKNSNLPEPLKVVGLDDEGNRVLSPSVSDRIWPKEMNDPNTFTVTPDEPVEKYLPNGVIWPEGYVVYGNRLIPDKPRHFLGQIVDYFPPDGSFPVAAMIINWDNGEGSLGTAVALNIFFPTGNIGYQSTVEQGTAPRQWNFKSERK